MDYFYQILDKYVRFEDNSIKSEITKEQLIIEIMKLFNENNDKEFAKNALVIILSLFDDYLKDEYFLNSKNISQITNGSRKIIIDELKQAIAL